MVGLFREKSDVPRGRWSVNKGSRGIFLFMLLCLHLCLGANMALGLDPSFEKTKACKENLKMLREALAALMKSNPKVEIPIDVTKYDTIYTLLLTQKFLPKQPVKPTTDCDYFLVYKNSNNHDWFCNLHGVVSGDQRLTFPYHEFEFTAQFNSNFLTLTKYKKHYDDVMRWTAYARTLSETVKYNYSRNPTTTLITVVMGLLFVWFVYRNIFG